MKTRFFRNSGNLKLLAPTLLFVVTIISFLINELVQLKRDQLHTTLTQEAAMIENTLLEKFRSTFVIINMMGEEISEKPQNKIHIERVLKKYKLDESFNQIFSWTIFSWADQHSQLTVDGEYGIMKNPIDLSLRDYMPQSISRPNQLVLGEPVFGSTSKKWMIPGGVTILDQNRKMLGTITIGFEINNLTKVIQSSLRNDNVMMELLYNNDVPVLRVGRSFIKIFSPEEYSQPNKKESLDQQIILTRNLKGYPYKLSLTYDDKAVSAVLWEIVYSRLIEILTVLLLSLALVFLIYKSEKIKRANINSMMERDNINSMMEREISINQSKSEFMLRVGHELRNFVAAIIGLSDLVQNDLKKKTISDTDIKNELEHLEHINDISEELMSFVTDLIDLNQSDDGKFEVIRSSMTLDFEDMIERSIRILKSKIRNQNINLHTHFEDNLNQIPNLDSRRIKQILVSIIGNAVRYSAKNSRVDIVVKNLDQRRVQISIKDNGSGMSNTEINKALGNYGFENYNRKSDSIELELPIIRFLVEKQNGALSIDSTKNYGTLVTIIF